MSDYYEIGVFMKLSKIILIIVLLLIVSCFNSEDGSNGSSVVVIPNPNNTVFVSQTIINKRYFKNGDTIELTVNMNSSDCDLSADFSSIDSEYSEGGEVVSLVNGSQFKISYTISNSNTTSDSENIAIAVKAEDSYGNENKDISNDYNTFLHLDNTAPVITVNEILTHDSTPMITGTITEKSADIEITINGITYSNGVTYGYNAIQIMGNSSPYTWKLCDNIISALTDSTYDVTVSATDQCGKSSSVTENDIIEIIGSAGTYIGDITDVTVDAYLDNDNNKKYRLINCSHTMEYSKDNSNWTPCISSSQTIEILDQDHLYVRQKDAPSIVRDLGVVNTSVNGDLVAERTLIAEFYGDNNQYYRDIQNVYPGKKVRIIAKIDSNSSEDFLWSGKIKLYYSADTVIDSNDILVDSECASEHIEEWKITPDGDHAMWDDFIIPMNLNPGKYYILAEFIPDDGVEYSTSNNVTPKSVAASFYVADRDEQLMDGAFKIVNSWGVGGNWENIKDGHYWITYDAMKHQKFYVYYYINDFTKVYNPSAVVFFYVNGGYRDESIIKIYLKDRVTNEIRAVKELQSRWESKYFSGHLAFYNDIAIDISEFKYLLDSCDVEINVDNQANSIVRIYHAKLCLYSDYDSDPDKTLNCSDTSVEIEKESEKSIMIDTGSITTSNISNISRFSLMKQLNFKINLTTKPTSLSDISKYQKKNPKLYKKKRYSFLSKYGKGSGLNPMTAEELKEMPLLTGASSQISNSMLPNSVDWSKTNYFPPIGDQGKESSCVAWSVGYYIHTYYEAKEHDWDLSSTLWDNEFKKPNGNLSNIFSPDFIYHQINAGVDDGSNYRRAAGIVTQLGCATWEDMPYKDYNHTSWPDEYAWKNAVRYRGGYDSTNYFDYFKTGYFCIESDEDIKILKQLLANGYMVSISVKSTSGGIYDYLDEKDVFNNTTLSEMETDHANTIVGYKEGTAWNPNSPDE